MVELQRAIAYRKSGNLEESKELLLQLVVIEPENAVILYQCAWTHDALGLEKEAVPFYTKALKNGLEGENRKGALLGLGSTYRTLGKYQLAMETLQKGIEEFPNSPEFHIFLAIVLYNKKEYHQSVGLLLKKLVELSDHDAIKRYEKAITYYSEHLDDVW
jgi:tetratricopeptide (TPR) repeat protein